MKSKAIWLTAVSLSSLTLFTAVSLGQATSQFWKPEVAQAAKVTARLFKSKSFNPVKLARHKRLANLPQKTDMVRANGLLQAGRSLDPKRTAR